MKSGILPLCHLVVCQAFSLLLGHRAFVFLSVLVRQVAELKAKVWGEVSSAPGEGPETKKTPGWAEYSYSELPGATGHGQECSGQQSGWTD